MKYLLIEISNYTTDISTMLTLLVKIRPGSGPMKLFKGRSGSETMFETRINNPFFVIVV